MNSYDSRIGDWNVAGWSPSTGRFRRAFPDIDSRIRSSVGWTVEHHQVAPHDWNRQSKRCKNFLMDRLVTPAEAILSSVDIRSGGGSHRATLLEAVRPQNVTQTVPLTGPCGRIRSVNQCWVSSVGYVGIFCSSDGVSAVPRVPS